MVSGILTETPVRQRADWLSVVSGLFVVGVLLEESKKKDKGL